MMAATYLPPAECKYSEVMVWPGPLGVGVEEVYTLAQMLYRLKYDQSQLSMTEMQTYNVLSRRNAVQSATLVTVDFDKALGDMRSLAAQQGINFDDILANAAANFASPQVMPWLKPMTDTELSGVIDHDDKSITE